ncbi:DUF1896 family protein [Muribaculaceae bacterium Isolate-105 (HZI)]|uniref:DUF1896 family protein n=1 Tax=Muribaculaceae TaxID=2005473 RepID=UPI000F4A8EB6|nr:MULTISPECIES: DUF1896 family protein [Muribaculaceae]ROS83198.1 DUF1896 family protein [Muribaculaceae bacterium Isolate-036 (Harlan)]ROT11623.1 DUF1896 family protein [Muribaculaceae bacterium Isolate-105 (HZI)]QCD38056.1 DUF1896 family protein [Duncaniella sp. C9]QCD40633.1 DUF1896 family protein [Duncaniella sp. C9]QCP71738.1 DUF1896 domain-containing protein [Duncaniella sp. B8]
MLQFTGGYYDLDYYRLYLLRYLSQNNFDIATDHPQIVANSDRALDTYEEARRNGASVPEAEELALSVLFTNIGESEFDIVADILLEYFGDTLNVDYEPAAHYWARWVIDNVPNLFDGFDRTQVGIDREELDEKRDILIGRITQFCVDNGL